MSRNPEAQYRKSRRRERRRFKAKYGMRTSGKSYVRLIMDILRKRKKRIITNKRKKDRRIKGKV